MLSTNRSASNGQAQPAASIGYADLKWYEIDLLTWCMDQDGDQCIAVTPGKPPYRIRKEYVYCRPLEKAKKFIDAGLIEYQKTEIYKNGASCDVYKLTAAGKGLVNDYYNRNHEKNAERDADFNTKRDENNRLAWRIMYRAELKKQFGANLYLPSIYPEIVDSKTPFIDAPLPLIAPSGRDGQPISIREYLFLLWTRLLTDKAHKMVSDFFTWGDAIGYENAADMLRENSNYSAYDLFGFNDNGESADTEGGDNE